jgi:hypothetical protein
MIISLIQFCEIDPYSITGGNVGKETFICELSYVCVYLNNIYDVGRTIRGGKKF